VIGELKVKATIVESIIGLFGFGEENEIAEKVLFLKNPEKIAQKLAQLEKGEIIEELKTLLNKLKEKGYGIFVFENSEIAKNVSQQLHVKTEVTKISEAGEILSRNIEKIAVEMGFISKPVELREFSRRVSLELTKLRIREAGEKRDLMIVQSILATEDLDKTINLFTSRIREWYGVHFPELDRLLDKHETYLRLVHKLGNRENFTAEALETEGLPKNKAEKIVEASKTSLGAKLTEQDVQQIQTLCRITLELYETRKSMDTYIEKVMEEVSPNINALVGSFLGAKLIALAGGVSNLAKKPASTIQVLGAEKALFRALRTGTRPPKHGILFQHTLIREAPKWQRGKIARALAGKIAIAARMDAFGGKTEGEEIKKDLEKRVEEIKEKYREPPQKKEQLRKHGEKKLKFKRKKQHGYRN
jgi:nucleolar protein 56